MPDIVTEVNLPSRGLIYKEKVQFENQLRAPRLRDRGLGDTTRKLKLQANILDATLLQPLGISAYDLHVADFVYLNLRQRQLSKGAAPYRVRVECANPACRKAHMLEVQLDDLELTVLKTAPKYEFTTSTGDTIVHTFITPRIINESPDRAQEFKDEYPGTELDLESLKTQEFMRALIKTVNGKKLTEPQMTDYLQNMLLEDIDAFVAQVSSFDFGLQFRRSFVCDSCGKKIVYDLPVG